MSMDWFNPHVPGQTPGFTFVDKQIMLNADYHIMDRIPITIAPNTGALDKGTILGVSSVDGLFHPVTRTTIAANTVAANPQVIGVANASIFFVGQTVSTMSATSGTVQTLGTITAINGNNITVSTELTTEAMANDWFYVSDGSQTAVVVLGDVVLDAASNKIANAYVAGKFVQSQLVGVDSIAVSDLKARQIPYFMNNAQDNILVV